jgi:hypothetical protein
MADHHRLTVFANPCLDIRRARVTLLAPNRLNNKLG